MASKRIPAGRLDQALIVAVVALVVFLSWYIWLQYNPGFGIARINVLAPPSYLADSVAISADGAHVAIVHEETLDGSGLFVIDVRSVQSGQRVSSLTIPPPTWAPNKMGYSMSPRLSFCDGGKYLVVFAPMDRLYVADTRTFTLRDPIHFYELRLTLDGAGPNPPGSPVPDGPVQFDCAASGNVAVLGFWADLGTAAIKLIDLDTGKEMADLGGSFAGLFSKGLSQRYQGDGLAISPDGSKVATVIWQYGDNGGPGVDLFDAQSSRLIKTLRLGDGSTIDHRVAFAGERALVIGEPTCEPNGKCDVRSLPRGRTLRVWDFGGSGAVREFHSLGTEAYRSFGASADGTEVFAYTGDESHCWFCNSRNGELKVHSARFTVWDRVSGKVMARSPSLRVENHSCPWLSLGACESYQQVPEMQMSANGESIVAFWPQQDFPPPDRVPALGELEVYALR